jgi:hypothetical protein
MGHAQRLVLVTLLGGVAHADVEVRTALELGVHAPRSLAIDLWAALSDRLVVGLTTSHASRHELGAGRGLCLSRCDDRLPDVLPDDDPYRFAGVAAEAHLLFAANLTGRVAIDTTRFAPTPASLQLGLDLWKHQGPYALLVAPAIAIGITRRDLDGNRDAGSVALELDRRTWCGGGLLAIARGEVALQALRSTPSLGAALGAWQELGDFTLSIRAGTSEVERASARQSVFGEIAVAWRR